MRGSISCSLRFYHYYYWYFSQCAARFKNNALPEHVGSHLGCRFVANLVAPLAHGCNLFLEKLQHHRCQQQHCIFPLVLFLLAPHRLCHHHINVPVSKRPGPVLYSARRCEVQQVGGKTCNRRTIRSVAAICLPTHYSYCAGVWKK
ncbi:hypothetical protein ElyMa_002896000 [Elysia marginata]|uniref:Uncharacterized protein n=1 Tax=Elysia marginata TaxID=1093978 RepID=A0AAV4I011_9GAST|nr:hypothetical protein ElyMa_002896000 [Elysia marginata]